MNQDNQPAHPHNPEHITQTAEFTSNPFIATLKGLGKTFTVNPATILILALLPFVAVFGLYFAFGLIAFLAALLDELGLAMGIVIGVFTFIAAIIFFLRATAGQIITFNESFRDKNVSAGDAFGRLASKKLTKLFLATLLGGLAVMFGFMFFFIPGLILLARFSLTGFAIYDEDLGARTGLKRSWQLTKGHTVEMLGVIFAQGVLSSNGLLSGITGFAGTANRYHELKNAEGKSTGSTHWMNYLVVILVTLGLLAYMGVLILVSAASETTSNSTQQNSLYDFNCYTNENNQFVCD